MIRSLVLLAQIANTLKFVNPNPLDYNDPTLNAVRLQLFGVITIASPNVSIHLFTPPRDPSIQAVITAGNYADLFVANTTSTLTKSQIFSTGNLTGNLTITAKPNPDTDGVYTVELEALTVMLNLNYYSPNFFQFQAVPFSNNPSLPSSGSTPVYFIFPGATIWLQASQELTFPTNSAVPPVPVTLSQGLLISESNKTTQLFASPATTITIPIQIPSSSLNGLADGNYFFSLLASMNSSAPPPNIPLQNTLLNNLIASINAQLTNTNLISLTPAQVTTLTANRTLLQKLIIK